MGDTHFAQEPFKAGGDILRKQRKRRAGIKAAILCGEAEGDGRFSCCSAVAFARPPPPSRRLPEAQGLESGQTSFRGHEARFCGAVAEAGAALGLRLPSR